MLVTYTQEVVFDGLLMSSYSHYMHLGLGRQLEDMFTVDCLETNYVSMPVYKCRCCAYRCIIINVARITIYWRI